ncbi:hypothetical protein [Actinoallomurus iriomotensis]|uniref:Tyr recombinase domain-containing protein n=1 Tax=Actinoallomurus iriomotensis TaxID=478107 RepID=A0A9W6S937_9ACTN|nr:hypothetical protein [Actinoallomurus iriomotensis]GLY87925.1 hypothetical protein Airi02_058540 [Actinoallomurus iriomotensis]
MLAAEDQVLIEHDRRYRALVLLATFESLRWGEMTALRRADIDLDARTVRVREQLIELDDGQMILAPPRSRAGKRTIGFPSVIIPELREHLDAYVDATPDAFVFLGTKGGFLRGATSAVRRTGHGHSPTLACPDFTSTTYAIPATPSPHRAGQARRTSRRGRDRTVIERR